MRNITVRTFKFTEFEKKILLSLKHSLLRTMSLKKSNRNSCHDQKLYFKQIKLGNNVIPIDSPRFTICLMGF